MGIHVLLRRELFLQAREKKPSKTTHVAGGILEIGLVNDCCLNGETTNRLE